MAWNGSVVLSCRTSTVCSPLNVFDRRFLSVNLPAHTKGWRETNKYVGRNVLSAIRHLLASDVFYPDVLLTERVCRAYISLGFWSECEEFQHEMASLCSDQTSIRISTVAVQMLLQKGDLDKATLWLRHCAGTRHHNKFFVGVIHECALLGNRAVCEEVEKLVNTDYILPRTRAALMRTYGNVNDSRRLLSSAREATAELPEVLSAVMDVATATSSVTLAELLLPIVFQASCTCAS